jgi:hypothetical protein
MREEYTEPLGAKWTLIAIAAWNDKRKSVLKDLCLRQYDHQKLLVLCTKYSAEGFGYVACQPADDNASMHAMHQCMHGSSFDFMTKDSTALLHPVTFGCCRMRGNKKRLHSHLGKAFAGDVAINKCHHMCFGQRFVWVTDCYALKFILSYDVRNPSILCLQLQFMCWDMIIKHRNDVCLTNVDCFSRLGADLCFDPLLKEYIQQAHALCCCSPVPNDMPIAPEFQPYFRGPRINSPKSQLPPQGLTMHANVATIPATAGLQHLQNLPVSFRQSPQSLDARKKHVWP